MVGLHSYQLCCGFCRLKETIPDSLWPCLTWALDEVSLCGLRTYPWIGSRMSGGWQKGISQLCLHICYSKYSIWGGTCTWTVSLNTFKHKTACIVPGHSRGAQKWGWFITSNPLSPQLHKTVCFTPQNRQCPIQSYSMLPKGQWLLTLPHLCCFQHHAEAMSPVPRSCFCAKDGFPVKMRLVFNTGPVRYFLTMACPTCFIACFHAFLKLLPCAYKHFV